MALRGDAVEAEPPRESGPLVRVVADVLEHGGIDLAGAPHLEPAGVLAEDATFAAAEEARHVELHRRFGEREVARPHAYLAVRSEHSLRKVQQRSFQVGECDLA